MRYTVAVGIAFVALLAFFTVASPAQNRPLEDRVSELEQRISELERKVTGLSSQQSSEKSVFGEKWKDIANWRKLQIGMDRAQVREIMGGEPDKIVRISHDLEIWYFGYPNVKIHLRNGRVESWSEP